MDLIKRRQFIHSVAAAPVGLHIASQAMAQPAAVSLTAATKPGRGSFAMDGHRVRFFVPNLAQAFKVWVIADTHLYRDDDRGIPFQPYSARMARAYNQTRHFQSGEPTNPEESFEKTLSAAREAGVDHVVLLGDTLSFPSEAGVEWVQAKLKASGIPHLYVAGNHDWHYEGMEGSLEDLRTTWIHKRLLPLYQGRNPMMHVQDIHGVRLVLLDDSHYQISQEQLDFFRDQVASGAPIALFVHIPLYAPGRSVGYGCGHPNWNAATDRNHEIERRPRWPETGHTEITRAFHREVFAAKNLIGIFAGHIHRPSLDVVHGIPQIVADANATGAYLNVEFIPQPA
jgi:predicted phosphodiesterase